MKKFGPLDLPPQRQTKVTNIGCYCFSTLFDVIFNVLLTFIATESYFVFPTQHLIKGWTTAGSRSLGFVWPETQKVKVTWFASPKHRRSRSLGFMWPETQKVKVTWFHVTWNTKGQGHLVLCDLKHRRSRSLGLHDLNGEGQGHLVLCDLNTEGQCHLVSCDLKHRRSGSLGFVWPETQKVKVTWFAWPKHRRSRSLGFVWPETQKVKVTWFRVTWNTEGQGHLVSCDLKHRRSRSLGFMWPKDRKSRSLGFVWPETQKVKVTWFAWPKHRRSMSLGFAWPKTWTHKIAEDHIYITWKITSRN